MDDDELFTIPKDGGSTARRWVMFKDILKQE